MAKGKKPEVSNKPAFNAYTVQDRGEGKDAFWLKIGAAFEHKDSKGFNLELQALPIDGRIVLREWKEPEKAE